MSKAHRGRPLKREKPQSGRGTCPITGRSGVKLLYEAEVDGKKVMVSKAGKATLGNSKKRAERSARAVAAAAAAAAIAAEAKAAAREAERARAVESARKAAEAAAEAAAGESPEASATDGPAEQE